MVTDLKTIAQCSACGASIIWAETSAGARMPVDASPVPEGNVMLFPTIDRKWLAIVMGVSEAKGRDLLKANPRDRYVSHFATCPHADTLRSNRPKVRKA